MLKLTDTREIILRQYQADAIEALRANIRAGRRRLILCAGTGAGKTLTSAHLLKEAARKGSYALFIVDRVALVDQTSAVFDEYGIQHGVVQGINDRWAPRENVQVCSAQTLARRALPRDPSLIVVDEAHCRYKATLDYMARFPDAVKIGLTATPFTPGMAADWDGMVNVRSTRLLIEDGHLIEPTIYVAKSPEDAELGLNSYGEFSDASASSAGIRIIGDVVAEWVQKTHEHFGGPVKTIVFSPTVDHGRELCAAFGAAGFNFQQISYLDRDDAARAEKIAEFRRPDSIIHGLISCGVLTKGFDVPDVRCGISCKPYRKSLSSHMQEIGRVMRSHPGKDKAIWLCLARDSKVLTNRGLVCIQNVTRHDKVWDGENFVSHGGAVCKGVQNVITYQGLTATPGHLVHTMDGWRTFGDCARQQISITQTGFGRTPVRISEDHFPGRALARGREATTYPCRLRVRNLSVSLSGFFEQLTEWTNRRLSDMWPTPGCLSSLALCSGSGAKASVRQSEQCDVSRIRRQGDQVQVRWGESRNALGDGAPRHSRGLQVQGLGSDQPGWALRAGQPSLVRTQAEPCEQVRRTSDCEDALVQTSVSRSPVRGPSDEEADHGWAIVGANSGQVEPFHINEEQAEVWDILDAGPRHRFTCEGLLVHNCHAGNIERFALDMFDVWENGADDLSKAEKRDSKPRERDEATREKTVCPECSGALRGNFCMACGWERPARSGIVTENGTLHAFDPAALVLTARAGLRAECLKDPRKVWLAALHYCASNTRNGEERARRWAYGLWRGKDGIYPSARLPSGWYDTPIPTSADPKALALVERESKRFRKQRKAA